MVRSSPSEIEANAAIVTERFAATDIIVSPLEATYLIWMDFREVIKKDPALLQRLESEAYFFASDGEAFGANGLWFPTDEPCRPTTIHRRSM
ncbi:hypothetical protein MGH68_02990 [Erysipelothrix sp. D19-032]